MPSAADPRPKVDLISRAGITTGLPEGFRARCLRCRYDLSGLPDSKCPECGLPFTVMALVAAWRERQDRPREQGALLAFLVLSLVCAFPVNVLGIALLWKLPALVVMWVLTAIWLGREREALRDEGHRLLWLWVPCASTAMGVALSPMLNGMVAGLAAIVMVWIAWVAWRRSPVMTAVVATAALTIPVALALVMGVGLLTSALAGEAQGHHWSAADYPSWYWKGVPGRTRGVNNTDAVRLAWILILVACVPALALVPLWLKLARDWARSGRKMARGRRRTL